MTYVIHAWRSLIQTQCWELRSQSRCVHGRLSTHRVQYPKGSAALIERLQCYINGSERALFLIRKKAGHQRTHQQLSGALLCCKSTDAVCCQSSKQRMVRVCLCVL
jgi:hypothetical protein